MADTRCVAPEYQLDVDVMILEYLLYQAIRAQLSAPRPEDGEREDSSTNSHPDVGSKREPERLLQIFDSFIQVFKHYHCDYTFEAGTAFNLTLLETIVLLKAASGLSSLSSAQIGSSDAVLCIPDAMRQLWLKEQNSLLEDRRQWVQEQEIIVGPKGTNSSGSKQAFLDEMDVSSWTRFQESHIIPNRSEHIFPLFSVLHRFMSLSAELAPVTGEINEKWMKLALQLMLQSALKLLSTTEDAQVQTLTRDIETPNSHHTVMPGLAECFAFGFISSRSDAFSNPTETELLINNIFASSPSSPACGAHLPPTSTLRENPLWILHRSQTLSEFRLPSHSAHSPSAFKDRISRLKHKYPYAPFEANLLRCLEHFWILNCSESVSGKPVLVQIEEGRLEGQGEKEFNDFLLRTGVKRDESGKVLLDL